MKLVKTIPLKIPSHDGPPGPGQVVARRYHLNRLIGKGGMGSVWHATDLTNNRTLAVKFILAEQAGSPELQQRFEREARASQRIESPHVVEVVAHGVDQGRAYLAMELLTGETLSAKLAREARLTLPVASAIIFQIAAGLEAAHQAGVVHRDLKPANVHMVEDPSGEGPPTAKIVDFGIAKALDGRREGATITETGDVLGSPGYMSPEQIRASKHVDHRADVWSLGVIAYRMLTGHRLFAGLTAADVMVRVCGDPIPPTGMYLTFATKELDAFFAFALHRNPDRRFPSARALADELTRIASTPDPETVVDDPPPIASTSTIDIRTTRKWAGGTAPGPTKRSRLFDLAAVLLVSAIATFGIWYWLQLEDEGDDVSDFTQLLDGQTPKVKVKSTRKKKGYTLGVTMPTRVVEELPIGIRLIVHSSCKVKGRQHSAEGEFARPGTRASEGKSSKARVRLYVDEPLDRKPSTCRLQLELAQYGVVEPHTAGVFCHRKGKTTEGDCDK